MSIELLILLFVFIVLPLIQQLLRTLQERDRGGSERADRPRPPVRRPTMPAPQPAAHVPPPHAPKGPRPLHERHAVTAHPRPPRRDTPSLVSASTARRAARGNGAIKRLRNPFGLRRAIMAMTILGPCRAISPSDL